MDRRDFVKTIGVIGASTLPGKKLFASDNPPAEDTYAMLIDTTRCVGCQTCTEACAKANGLPEPDLDAMDEAEVPRNTSETQWTLVNSFEVNDEEIYVKKQCMHCLQPACATACPTKALYKTPEGPVIWRGDKCMGCRFCMISCPFDIPKFEYSSNNPKIQKCRMCFEKLQDGEMPVCASECPAEAITFGKRSELIEEARTRIYDDPDTYNHHIYGEHEVGGTSVLYLAAAPFSDLGFNTKVGKQSYPELTKTFLYSVPVIDLALPAFLLILREATKHSGKHEE